MNSIKCFPKLLLLVTIIGGIPLNGISQGLLKFSTIKGKVIDRRTEKPVPFSTAFLYEIDVDGEYIPVDTIQTQQDAAFSFFVGLNGSLQNFMVIGIAPEYLVGEKRVQFVPGEPIEESGVEVVIKLGNGCTLGLESMVISFKDIYFEKNEDTPTSEYYSILDLLCDILINNSQIKMQISGHCDLNEIKSKGQTLSEKRAEWVVDYLVNKGIDRGRLVAAGYGVEHIRINPELNEEDKQINRRVEFRILSIEYSPATK